MFFRSVNPKTFRKTKQTRFQPGLEPLELRWNPAGTGLAGNITQGNLYGDQSVVMALPLAGANGADSQIQLIDTGSSGIGAKTVNSFVPFLKYHGSLSLAVGDFLNKGYQQLIVSASGAGTSSHVIVVDLFKTLINKQNSSNSNAAFQPVLIRNFVPFDPGFKGGAVVAAGDFDADGLDDLAVGAGIGGGPHVLTYRNGNPLDRLSSFYAFGDAKFRGGVSLAAGHFDGDGNGDLIVGAGVGGKSRVVVYSGKSISAGVSNPPIMNSFTAIKNYTDKTAVNVVLIESVVAPEPIPSIPNSTISPIKTPLFTPTNNAPLITGTIAAFDPNLTNGVVSLATPETGLVIQGAPKTGEKYKPTYVNLPSTGKPVYLAPVGYMFDNNTNQSTDPYPPPRPKDKPIYSVKNNVAPMVLVANTASSTISLYPLDQGKDKTVKPIQNIYNTPSSKPTTFTNSFPFGAQFGQTGNTTTGYLGTDVTTIYSAMSTVAVAGTAGKIPCRQVAFQSPFPLQFSNSIDSLFSDFSTSPWNDPTKQTTRAQSEWYGTDGSFSEDPQYGPSVNAYAPPSNSNVTFLQERMLAAGLQIMNRGYAYQHHHMPAWFQPINGQSENSTDISKYDVYSLTPPGMQTPGLDCSDFTGFITAFGLGFTIPTGITEQGAIGSDGKTEWKIDGKKIEQQGTSNITIKIDGKDEKLDHDGLNNFYLQEYDKFQKNPDTANNAVKLAIQSTYAMLNSTLKTGDLLYYQGPEKPDGTHDATHVTMWVGDVIPGTSVPLVMDSHGGAIQVGVDSDGNPTGLVAPSGPQLRPWFIPNPPPPYPKQKDDPNPPANESDANYFYFNNFFHVVRLDALNK